ncbi:MAG: glutathione peroxidase [Bacteroidales bacterium]|nr:glutathione peroxidase [Bacteroidales bacterium]
MSTIYDYTATLNNGKELKFEDLKGKVILVVNTASKCGFTPQYKGLEALYKKYGEKGLCVVGFPCDQFANQEPGDDATIAQFCEINFGVTFPLTKKCDVNGANAHPVFKYLCEVARGTLGKSIKWNFTKFLISRDGATIKRYAPQTEPEKFEDDIVAMLG